MVVVVIVIIELLIFFLIVFIHELGHYIDAKRQGIYEKLFFNGIMVGIKTTKHMRYGFNYLGGLIYSMLLYPIVLLLASNNIIIASWWYIYPLLAIVLSALDIVTFIFYKNSWKNTMFVIIRYTPLNRFVIKLFDANDQVIWLYTGLNKNPDRSYINEMQVLQ